MDKGWALCKKDGLSMREVLSEGESGDQVFEERNKEKTSPCSLNVCRLVVNRRDHSGAGRLLIRVSSPRSHLSIPFPDLSAMPH